MLSGKCRAINSKSLRFPEATPCLWAMAVAAMNKSFQWSLRSFRERRWKTWAASLAAVPSNGKTPYSRLNTSMRSRKPCALSSDKFPFTTSFSIPSKASKTVIEVNVGGLLSRITYSFTKLTAYGWRFRRCVRTSVSNTSDFSEKAGLMGISHSVGVT